MLGRQGSSLMPSTPTASALERQRQLRTLLAAGTLGLTILLILAFEGWQQSALLSKVEPTRPDALGLPSETLVVHGRSTKGAGWWHMWQTRLADQEARVGAWRERQRTLVYEETAAEEALAAAAAKGSNNGRGLGDGDSGEAWAGSSEGSGTAVEAKEDPLLTTASEADPLLEDETAAGQRLGLEAVQARHGEGEEESEQEAAAAMAAEAAAAQAAAAAGGASKAAAMASASMGKAKADKDSSAGVLVQ